MKPLSLDMSDPLTLGMGHPVTERIRRLSMRKTNIRTRSGTCAVIIAALGISAPIFSGASASPVTEAVDTLTQQRLEPIIKAVSAPQTEPQNLTELAPQTLVEVEAKTAVQSVTKTARNTGLKPMRLRLTPRFTTEQIDKIVAYRKAVAGGDAALRDGTDGYWMSLSKKNRMQLIVNDEGQGVLDISNGNGGWPGYPVTNVDWEMRPLSPAMETSLRGAMQRCAKETTPIYFLMNISGGDPDLGKGNYEIECLPGSERVQAATTSIDLAHAYLASEELPLERRQGNFKWMMPFALFHNYVRTTTNATIAGDRAECVRIYTLMKEKYGFTENSRKSADHHLESCATKDYNWVRKRENLPLIQ